MVRVSIERSPQVVQGSSAFFTVAILARGGERPAVDRCTCLMTANLRSGCSTAARAYVLLLAREFAVPCTCAHAEPFSTTLSRSLITPPQQSLSNRLKSVAVQILTSIAVSARPVSIQHDDPPCLPPVRIMYRSASRPVPLGRAFLRHLIRYFVFQPQILKSTAASARPVTDQRDDPPCLHLCAE